MAHWPSKLLTLSAPGGTNKQGYVKKNISQCCNVDLTHKGFFFSPEQIHGQLAHSLIVTGFLRIMEALMMSEPCILSLCLFDLVS